MRLVDHTIQVSDLNDPVKFLVFADIHEGAAGVDYDLLRTDVSEVKNEENAYGIYLGDGVDAVRHDDLRRFDLNAIHPWYIDPEHPERLEELAKYQSRRVCAVFDTIRPKMICGVKGNHGDAYVKRHGFDPDRELAEQMGWLEPGKQVRYSHGVLLLRVTFVDGPHSSQPILFAMQHFCGGGSASVDSNLNWLERIVGGTWSNPHIFIAAHIHKRGARRRSKIKVPFDGAIRTEPEYQWFCVTGAYLRNYVQGASSYAEGRYKPSDLGALRVVITPATGEIHAY